MKVDFPPSSSEAFVTVAVARESHDQLRGAGECDLVPSGMLHSASPVTRRQSRY